MQCYICKNGHSCYLREPKKVFLSLQMILYPFKIYILSLSNKVTTKNEIEECLSNMVGLKTFAKFNVEQSYILYSNHTSWKIEMKYWQMFLSLSSKGKYYR